MKTKKSIKEKGWIEKIDDDHVRVVLDVPAVELDDMGRFKREALRDTFRKMKELVDRLEREQDEKSKENK